ncbi:hypothetical protein CO038_01495 [Candidatus Pacearchaeota archaeon CG_4_9_14_0_2_um_filter_39_13]|nr:hypothetical protein [Candidatus Pacearchaeota archaeon]OIO43788.1 MAG: hypothetical protein AUJ64_01750 [Candidatus Pacearchaeota archaeon CG1_02_39_14]PJC44883.1 MAG: hypothetical protein CO038_01495 [Candidatus Pacearchaeota archaeon CG_4_9_14_0_2_um_filter_39_13]
MSSEVFYSGGKYPLSEGFSGYKDYAIGMSSRYPASSFGIPSDPRAANQLKAVADKFATGTKTIEVSGVQAAQFESLPQQHLKEINRLKKLVGADLTFHGPIVEPTGVTRQGWDPSHRQQAERQMWSAVERAHELDPDGNIVVTFHSSASLPEPETRVYDPATKQWVTKSIAIVDERTGQFDNLQPKPDYFKGGTEEKPQETVERINKERWFRELQYTNSNAYAGVNTLQKALAEFKVKEELLKDTKIDEKGMQELYKLYLDGKTEDLKKAVKPETAKVFTEFMQEVAHGDIYLREAYQNLQELYNQAYAAAKKENRTDDIKKLDNFQKGIAPHLKDIEDPSKISEFGEEIVNGINVLRSIKTPERLKPLKEFAVNQAAETFSNIAMQGYKKFKDTAPIISVENPPAGGGLNRADDLRDLMKASRERFADKAQKELGMSRSQAEKQAEKLIGITWDVGHINMIRKFGAEDKHLIQETKTIAPYVKHIHLSDNFGMEHTELPMGMGNVPIKKEMEILEKYGKRIKDIKKIAETGNWFGPQGFGNKTPFLETIGAFGSPVYAMKMSPYWNQAMGVSSGYFSGRGMNPDVHHTYFGAGYTNLPLELGGQAAGRSRLSGTPTE